MVKIAFHAPLLGNGGIVSWSKRYINTFSDSEFEIIHIDQIQKPKSKIKGLFSKAYHGFSDIIHSIRQLNVSFAHNHFDILHTTTSGGLGNIRDYFIARWAKKHNVRSVIHCHYGYIPEVIRSGGIKAKILIKVLSQYDQIWILDRYTQEALEAFPSIKSKLRIAPNNIDVSPLDNIPDKTFHDFAFIANLYLSKGIIEAVSAFAADNNNVRLHIAGPDPGAVVEKIKEIAGAKWGDQIKYYGQLPNNEAIGLLEKCDALVLPTYYPGEAFPISILEAMSLGKLVVATPRAAIRDMLTTDNDRKCGVFIQEKSSQSISDAIKWIFDNKNEANEMCRLAYNKASSHYNTEVVYRDIYRPYYRELLNL